MSKMPPNNLLSGVMLSGAMLCRDEVYRRRVKRRVLELLGAPPGTVKGVRAELAEEGRARPEELPGQRHKTKTQADGRVRSWGLLRAAQRLGVLPGGAARCACEAIPREADTPAGLCVAHGAEAAGEEAGWHLAIRGLKLCKNLNTCPICARQRGLEWAKRIARWAGLHLAQGGGLYMATLTLRHRRGQTLRELGEWFTRAWGRWRAPSGGGVWDPASGLPDLAWYVRGQEETYGQHGWHTHVHVLLATPKWLDGTGPASHCVTGEGDALLRRYETGSRDLAASWAGELVRRWIEAVEATAPRSGAMAVSQAQDVRSVPDVEGIERYLCKLGLEVSAVHAKESRSADGRSPFQILADLVTYQSEEDARLWAEYCRERSGARRISTSLGASHPDRLFEGQEWEEKARLHAPAPLEWRQIACVPMEGMAALVAARVDVALREWVRLDGWEVHRLELLWRYHAELLGPSYKGRGWVGLWRDLMRDLLEGHDPPSTVKYELMPCDVVDEELVELEAARVDRDVPPLELLDMLDAPTCLEGEVWADLIFSPPLLDCSLEQPYT